MRRHDLASNTFRGFLVGHLIAGIAVLSFSVQAHSKEPPTVDQVKEAFREAVRATGHRIGENTEAVLDREAPRVAQAIEDMKDVRIFVEKTNGTENGFCYAIYPNNQIQRMGYYRSGKRIGDWRFYYPDGSLSTKAQYNDDGEEVGQHMVYLRNGNVHYIETYVAGLKHGPKTTFYEDGSTHMHQMWQQGQMHGLSVIYHPNGVIKKFGWWSRGRQHGNVTTYDENGRLVLQDEYIDGQKQ